MASNYLADLLPLPMTEETPRSFAATCAAAKKGEQMADIPLGFSFEETDAGFVLRNKTENGSLTEIAIPPEEIIVLKAAVDLWSDRLLLSLPGAGSTAVPVLVHSIENTVVVEHPQEEQVILMARGRSGSQINLQLPLTLADLLAHDMTELVAKMKGRT